MFPPPILLPTIPHRSKKRHHSKLFTYDASRNLFLSADSRIQCSRTSSWIQKYAIWSLHRLSPPFHATSHCTSNELATVNDCRTIKHEDGAPWRRCEGLGDIRQNFDERRKVTVNSECTAASMREPYDLVIVFSAPSLHPHLYLQASIVLTVCIIFLSLVCYFSF